jgi:hypothetical protein
MIDVALSSMLPHISGQFDWAIMRLGNICYTFLFWFFDFSVMFKTVKTFRMKLYRGGGVNTL